MELYVSDVTQVSYSLLVQLGIYLHDPLHTECNFHPYTVNQILHSPPHLQPACTRDKVGSDICNWLMSFRMSQLTLTGSG